MIGYLLREPLDPKGDRAAVVSTGPDDLSCQAEILGYFRHHQNDDDFPKGQVFGHYVVDKGFTKATWLDAIPAKVKEDVLKAKADIERQGFISLCKGQIEIEENTGKMVRLVGRPAILEQFRLRTHYDRTIASFGQESMKSVLKKMGPELEEALANPLHAGVHPDFAATVNEETWIQDAVASMKAMGANKWMRTMVGCLRDYFGGHAREIIPNKNDRCPCKSGRKYGKCCGAGVIDTDPEECKLGRHQFGDWTAGNQGKFFRGCERCLKIDEAPYGEEVVLEGGTKVALIGCRVCTQAPSLEDAQKVLDEWFTWYRCSACSNPFEIQRAVCAHHVKADGTHETRWTFVTVWAGQNTRECRYQDEAGKDCVTLIHTDCFQKAFPHIMVHGEMSAQKASDGLMVTRKRKDSDK